MKSLRNQYEWLYVFDRSSINPYLWRKVGAEPTRKIREGMKEVVNEKFKKANRGQRSFYPRAFFERGTRD